MKKFVVFAATLVLLSATQAPAQIADPFAPAPKSAASKSANSDPFGGTSKTQPSSNTSKQRTAQAKVAKAVPRGSSSHYLAVGADSESHRRIERALDTEASFDYLDLPLKEAVEDISFTHNIPIVIDARSLEELGISTDTPLSLQLKGVRLRSALKLMLGELDLTYMIRDEVLQITTLETAESRLSTRFYPVSELLPETKDGKILVDLITMMVAPDSWSTLGGPASIVYLEHLEALAISQTDEVFYEIGNLLAATKKLAEMTTSVGPVRVTPVPDQPRR